MAVALPRIDHANFAYSVQRPGVAAPAVRTKAIIQQEAK
jgi:hypothetical protein